MLGSFSFDETVQALNPYSSSQDYDTFWVVDFENIYDFERINSRKLPKVRIANSDISGNNISLAFVKKSNGQIANIGDATATNIYPLLTFVPNSGVLYLQGSLLFLGERFTPDLWSVDEPFFWHSFQVYSTQYKLNIIVDGTIIFSRTETNPPEYVELFGRECSEGLCPVRCGEQVCCYGSDGIAQESFLLSESIYQ